MNNQSFTIGPQAYVTVKRSCSRILKQSYLIFLIILLTGALQRPLGGGELEGSMTGTIIQGDNPVFKVLMMGVFGLTLMTFITGLRHIRLPNGTGWALAFNALVFASTIWSALPQVTFQGAVAFSFSTMVALYAYNFHSWSEFSRALVQVMAGLIVVTGLLGLLSPSYAFHSTSEFFAGHAGLLKGSYTHKNSLGAMLTLALVVVISLGRDVFGRWLYWGLIAWAFWLIVQTGSAKSFVSVPAALLMGGMLARGSSRVTIGLLAGYVILSILLLLSIGVGFNQLAEGAAETLGRDVTFSGRTLIWQTAIDYTMMSGQWLFGGGYQTAWTAGIGEYSQQVIGFNAGHPHNGFIAIFIDCGLIGLGLILAASLSALKAGIDPVAAIRERRFIISVLTMILVTNISGTSLSLPVSVNWLLFFLFPFIHTWKTRK